MSELEGLPVVVTGGSGALGVAVVQRLLDEGAVCHLPLRDARAAAHAPWAGHPLVRLETGIDLANEAQVARFYAALPALWASIHLAGDFVAAPVTETSADALERMLSANLKTAFLCCREAARAMRARPAEGRRGGRIVNVASRSGVDPRQGAGMAAYAASKAAVVAITQALGEELSTDGIFVNAVAPRIIDTPANRKAMPKADRSSWTSPETIADAILSLISPLKSPSRGAVVPV